MSSQEGPSELNLLEQWQDMKRGLREAFFKQESDRLQLELLNAEKAERSKDIRRILTEKRDLIDLMKASAEKQDSNV